MTEIATIGWFGSRGEGGGGHLFSLKTLLYFSAITARVFKFGIHLERGQVYCGKENQDAVINFYLLFLFFLGGCIVYTGFKLLLLICLFYFFISLSDFQILKFSSHFSQDL